MRWDGQEFHRLSGYGWRRARKGETYINGKPISGYCVIFIRPSGTVVPLLGHGGTNYAYTPGRGPGKRYDRVLLVKNGIVYNRPSRPMGPS